MEKFDGEGDFTLWKHKVLAQLEILGFQSVLQPEATVDPKGKGVQIEGVEQEVIVNPLWLEKDRRVRNLLSLSLADMVLRKVIKEPTAYDTWTALENTYQAKSLPHRFYLKQRFYSFKMDEDKNLDKNLDSFNKLISDLSSLNVEMSEEDQAAILLNILPKRFDNLVHTLKYSSGKDTITLKEIIRSAYSIELEQKEKGVNKKKPADEGLFLQTRGRTEKRSQSKGRSNNRSKSRQKSKRSCWICGSEDHLKRDCPRKIILIQANLEVTKQKLVWEKHNGLNLRC